jgi:hypothetical protein
MPPLAKVVTFLSFIRYQNAVRATVQRFLIEILNHISAAGVGDVVAIESLSNGASQVETAHFYNGGYQGTVTQSTTDSFGEACPTYDILSPGLNTVVVQKQVTKQPFDRYFRRYLDLYCLSKRWTVQKGGLQRALDICKIFSTAGCRAFSILVIQLSVGTLFQVHPKNIW